MSHNKRQQHIIERIYEDERLHDNVTDTTAMALIEWATAQVKQVTDDPTQPDDIVEKEVQAIRKAARMAARVPDVTSQTIVDYAKAFLLETRSAQDFPASHTSHRDDLSVLPSSTQDAQPGEHNVDTTMDKRSQTWWKRWIDRFQSHRKDS